MRVLLVAALCATAYAANETCGDADGDGGASDAVTCAAGSFYTAGGDATPTVGTSDAGQTECCTACNSDVAGAIATCTGALANEAVTCNAGYGFNTNACTLCAGVQFSAGGTDDCANWTNLTAACNGANYFTAGSNAADDSTCTACTGANTTTCDVTGALTCAAGWGIDTNACVECVAGTSWNNDDSTAACASTSTCVVTGQAGATRSTGAATTTAIETCEACTDTTNAWSCTAAAGTAATCNTNGFWANAGTCEACSAADPVVSSYVHAVINEACTSAAAPTVTFTCDGEWWNKDGATTAGCEEPATVACVDGEFQATALADDADRVCTACTAGAATCAAADDDTTCVADDAALGGYWLDAAGNGGNGKCTACAALGTAPANTSAHTTTCAADGTTTVVAGITCEATHVDTNGTAADGCEAAAATEAPTTTVAPTTTEAPSSADGSDTSPAFIVGTAIAGIALLL